MQRITKDIKEKILAQAIEKKNYLGMTMMHLGPKSQKILTKLGVKTANEQTVRSISTNYKGRTFILFLLDGEKKENIWTFWEIKNVPSKWTRWLVPKETWRGYLIKQYLAS